MKKYVMKPIFILLLTTLVSVSSAASSGQAPTIETVDVWPQDLEHNSEVYVEAEIQDSGDVDAWMIAKSNGETVSRGTLYDSNDDGYYTAAASFRVKGDRSYTVKVNSCDAEDNCSMKQKKLRPDCRAGLLDRCVY